MKPKPKKGTVILTVTEHGRGAYEVSACDGARVCMALLSICHAMQRDHEIPEAIREAAMQFVGAIAAAGQLTVPVVVRH